MTEAQTSTKLLAIRGSMWTAAGHAGALVIRMGRSMIMTRLLYPEAYGLMTLVWAVLYGMQMFADTGIVATIIRDKRGDDPDFLNTAWTSNVFRGLALSALACLIALPLASAYSQPALVQLLPVAGLTALIHGFVSTSIYTARRHMDFKRLTLLDLSNEVVTFVFLVAWAYFFPSVWALVGGAVISQIYLVLASYLYLPGTRNKFRWDRSALDTFMHFGKWIYLSSAVYFLSTQSDRFLLGSFLDMASLGVYGTATVLSGAAQTIILKINSDVLLPAYSRVVPQGAEKLRAAIYRSRLAIDAGLVFPIAVAVMLAPSIVRLLYDSRYQDAGWMLQILCLRLVLVATLSNSESCLLALGKANYSFIQNLSRAIAILISIPIGWSLFGTKGVIWAIALSELLPLAVMWIGLARLGMFRSLVEFRTVLFAVGGTLVGSALLHFWNCPLNGN
jgi:O-antigen/teichoic acid export membrane protein